MSNHIAKLSRSCFFHLRQFRLIRQSLTPEAMNTLVQSFITNSSGLLQQCTDRRQQSVATQDAGDSERRSSFHHWSQEVRAHDASVTRPSLATSTAKDQVQDGRTGLQASSWHGSTIPDIILHTGLCSNWTFQLAIRDNRPIRCAAY